jgi:WXG100 family type VII secretion target
MGYPMGMDFQITQGVIDEFDSVSQQIYRIIGEVVDNGKRMRAHWAGVAAQHFDQNNQTWLTKAEEMDAAFGGVSQALVDIKGNFQQNEVQVANLFA